MGLNLREIQEALTAAANPRCSLCVVAGLRLNQKYVRLGRAPLPAALSTNAHARPSPRRGQLGDRQGLTPALRAPAGTMG